MSDTGLFTELDNVLNVVQYADKLTQKENIEREEQLKSLSNEDRLYELIKDKYKNWLGESNQKAIEQLLKEKEEYKQLYLTLLTQYTNDTKITKKKQEQELELLNEGWQLELQNYVSKNLLRTILRNKLEELEKPSEDRWETDEEKHNRLVIEIRLIKEILGIINDK